MAVGDNLLNYSGQANIAYTDALNQARNTQNSLFRQYGYTSADADGSYSVEGAQKAFDPNNLFDAASGKVDEARVRSLSANMRIGSKGVLADTVQAGASGEANAVSELSSRGIGGGMGVGGGLLAQRRNLAEAQASGALGAVKEQFLGGIAGALAPIGGAWQQKEAAREAVSREEARLKIEAGAVNAPTDPTGEVSAGVVTEESTKPTTKPTTKPRTKKPANYARRTVPGKGKQQYIGGKWKNVK